MRKRQQERRAGNVVARSSVYMKSGSKAGALTHTIGQNATHAVT